MIINVSAFRLGQFCCTSIQQGVYIYSIEQYLVDQETLNYYYTVKKDYMCPSIRNSYHTPRSDRKLILGNTAFVVEVWNKIGGSCWRLKNRSTMMTTNERFCTWVVMMMMCGLWSSTFLECEGGCNYHNSPWCIYNQMRWWWWGWWLGYGQQYISHNNSLLHPIIIWSLATNASSGTKSIMSQFNMHWMDTLFCVSTDVHFLFLTSTAPVVVLGCKFGKVPF